MLISHINLKFQNHGPQNNQHVNRLFKTKNSLPQALLILFVLTVKRLGNCGTAQNKLHYSFNRIHINCGGLDVRLVEVTTPEPEVRTPDIRSARSDFILSLCI